MPMLSSKDHFYARSLSKTTVACSVLLSAAWAITPTQVDAASLSLFYEHDVAEFNDPTGRIGKTVTDRRPIDRTMRHDIEFDSQLPCCATGAASNVIRSFSNGDKEQFGRTVNIRTGDVGAETRTFTAGGQVGLGVEMLWAPGLSFRISKTSLKAAQGTTARLSFGIFAHELIDPSRNTYDSIDEILAGPVVTMGQYEAILFGGDRNKPTPTLTIMQSGFDTLLPEPAVFEAGPLNTGWDFGVFEGDLNLAPQGFETGDRFGLSYNWEVSVTSEYGGSPGTAFASFFDPISSEGGLSFDRTDLREIPIGPVPAVPLPAGLWFLFTGMLSLVLGGSRIGRCRRTAN